MQEHLSNRISEAVTLSVVVGVFNGGDNLKTSLDSVLAQTEVDLELIVVDDGSTDRTTMILAELAARDQRLRVITQAHGGLTRALIAGCAAAKGKFIARQDAGDQSLPGRFSAQLAALRAVPDAVMVACGTRNVGPAGEVIREVSQLEGELDRCLGSVDRAIVRGPSHHGAVMFRREAYEAVGGYRPAFRVAQDLDLWMRLREYGRCLSLPMIGYEAELAAGSISFRRRREQQAAFQTILRASVERRAGRSDAHVIAEYERAQTMGADGRPSPVDTPDRADAAYYYFIARLIERTDVVAAEHYLCEALKRRPLNVKYRLQAARLAVVAAARQVSSKGAPGT